MMHALALSLTLGLTSGPVGPADAYAATGLEEFTMWAAHWRAWWVAQYQLALASGNNARVAAIVEELAQLLGVSYSEALGILQGKLLDWATKGVAPTPLLFIQLPEDTRGGAMVETEDLHASMRVNMPGGESGDSGGSVETDCIGGTDENGDDADCADDAIPTASVGEVDAIGLGTVCVAWTSNSIGYAADVECDAIPGDSWMPSYVVVLED